MAGRLTNFEIYGDNPERLAAFYRELFAWRIERAEGVDTSRPAFARQGWMNFVEVESLDATLKAAERLGGTILKPRTAVPRTAWHAVIADPAGNAFLVWRSDPLAFPLPEPD